MGKRQVRKSVTVSIVALVAFTGASIAAQQVEPPLDRTVLPIASGPFKGKIDLRAKDSVPSYAPPVRAPAGAPNVVVILLDDVGFGASSTFGGPINTPNLQRLADRGLKYNRFHTAALCSPTRAALLTGRNHHSVHSGVVTEMATGFPGYDSEIGKDTASIGEMLKLNGYNTAFFGKHHNVSDWESSASGPFDRWPTGLGFEKFYGFIGGETNHYRPAVYDGTTPIEPYIGKRDYHFDYDLADQAIKWIDMQKAVTPDKPFFIYYAATAMHAPQQAKPEWAAKYKGRFDQGYDKLREETFERQKRLGVIPADTKLTPRPASMPAWESLTPKQKAMSAHFMELAAGYLEQADYNIGRVLDGIEAKGQLDNTLVMYVVGDNGGAAEGTLQGAFNDMSIISGATEDPAYLERRKAELGSWKSSNLYPAQWAWAMNAPFQWVKKFASHFGGTRNGLVVSWPNGIKARGEVRSQFHHVIDIVPTILEAAHIPQPVSVNGTRQKPIEGVSMVYSFDNARAPDRRKTQYFEIFGNVGIYHEGWVAMTTPLRVPWSAKSADMDILTTRWELYNIDQDFSEADDLAAKYPAKLKEMQEVFFAEAKKYNVLPLDSSAIERFGAFNRPSLTAGRTSFAYHGGIKRIPEGAAPDIKNRSWSLTADLVCTGRDSGMIATQGGLSGGWSLYFVQGKPVFSYMFADGSNYRIAASRAVPKGAHKIVADFIYDGGGYGKGGTVTVRVDGQVYATGRVEKTIPFRFSTEETLDFGEDTGTPVDLSYDVPFRFTGQLGKVTIDLK